MEELPPASLVLCIVPFLAQVPAVGELIQNQYHFCSIHCFPISAPCLIRLAHLSHLYSMHETSGDFGGLPPQEENPSLHTPDQPQPSSVHCAVPQGEIDAGYFLRFNLFFILCMAVLLSFLACSFVYSTTQTLGSSALCSSTGPRMWSIKTAPGTVACATLSPHQSHPHHSSLMSTQFLHDPFFLTPPSVALSVSSL